MTGWPGGAGDDVLTGGAGADIFVIRGGYGVETVTDFGAEDTLMIERGVVGGDGPFPVPRSTCRLRRKAL